MARGVFPDPPRVAPPIVITRVRGGKSRRRTTVRPATVAHAAAQARVSGPRKRACSRAVWSRSKTNARVAGRESSPPDSEHERERRLRHALTGREVPGSHLSEHAPLDASI